MTATRYYVTVIREGSERRVGYLLGPFDDAASARELIPHARQEAERADPFTAFDAFGVTAVTRSGRFPRGVLNERCGL